MSKSTPEAEAVIVKWLKARYQDYVEVLLELYLQNGEEAEQSTALTLLMRLVKQDLQDEDDKAAKKTLEKLVSRLLLLPEGSSTREEFGEKYLQVYDDIRFYTFEAIASIFSSHQDSSSLPLFTTNTLTLLSPLTNPPTTPSSITSFHGPPPPSKSHLLSHNAHKTTAQTTWLALLRTPLTPAHRKTLLTLLTPSILPWLTRPELLMDFLTDSYNAGGSTSLLALSGLFYLMRTKNLDYPSFYPKLYSLLDADLLHSKHRSKFFRLLDVFMSSSHLPAALVASFIKRLSRLSLLAPPAAIVVVVPWAYNMFKRHPACTFMLHRENHAAGYVDPFDMSEADPTKTRAIESSVWELETLAGHYHPNVATLAGVLGEQFTKRGYEVEDFLGMGYKTIIDAELAKDIKKAPVIEYEIPRHIFTSEEEGELSTLGTLMGKVFESR
ncbi:CBF-domain-containing protein [Lophium mytilinum]|uniref:CBF-domain-containing protein n=1 Tax=Lophium mytilinum TaxID=390894 RepID=A0A6A6QYB6_9PEZI|nr:CBF-domain-containing protein [Lophium mytilinum]